MFGEYKEENTLTLIFSVIKKLNLIFFFQKLNRLVQTTLQQAIYCRKKESKKGNKKIYKLIGGKDKTKDQSYFLCQLNQIQLSKVLFPIGDLKKLMLGK